MLKYLSSVKVALILIVLLIGISVSATLYGVTDVFHGWPFRVIMICFFVNLLSCTLKLLPGFWRLWRKDMAEATKGYEDWSVLAEPSDGTDHLVQVESYLQAGRFRYQCQEEADGKLFFATKGRLSLWGPHILHVGILLVLCGAFLTSFNTSGRLSAFVGQEAVLPQAVIGDVGAGHVQVTDFQTLYDDAGAIDNWVTTFDLYLADGTTVTDATTRVNAPYVGHGLTIYQTAYGYNYLIKIAGAAEDTGEYAIPAEQLFALGEKEFVLNAMGSNNLLLVLYENGMLTDRMALHKGVPAMIDEATSLTFVDTVPYTVLETKVSKGLPLLFTGFTVAVLASFFFWVGRYREIVLFVDGRGRLSGKIWSKNKMIAQETQESLLRTVAGYGGGK